MLCSCGCEQKVKFGRRYFNSRSADLRAVKELGMLVHSALTMRPIPNTPQHELDKVRLRISSLAADCLFYSNALHDYSIGLAGKHAVSNVLSNRPKVFSDELTLIDATCYSASFCLLNGSMSNEQFLQQVEKFSDKQKMKVKQSFDLVRRMASIQERARLPKF